ncbi:nucleoside triphosphate pyrophosphohydrolase [Dasania marina]|uniref:nucleoside triphosphate pyrophosphohydrolase n=1 Tax=Dasania marina TaxID=471499 RepID=UPI00037EA07B|nr:nucleoside triphosphate pyrophosphohydrolase [Dasania marina]
MPEPMYSLQDLQYLMQRLRDPQDGCHWDKEQTFASIVPHTLEESYELADAIARNDMAHIKEELGDVLFQVIFYSQLGAEQQAFSLEDVIHQLTAKLIRRHPHVFPSGELHSRAGQQQQQTEQVKASWEAIKQQERQQKQQHSLLADVPLALPALNRAAKLQKRAAKVGFDWNDISKVIDKLHEELAELEQAQQGGDKAEIESELGDILFCCVNLARHLQVNPESALRSTNRKFERRFAYIEQQLHSRQQAIADSSLELLESLWLEAKQQLG